MLDAPRWALPTAPAVANDANKDLNKQTRRKIWNMHRALRALQPATNNGVQVSPIMGHT